MNPLIGINFSGKCWVLCKKKKKIDVKTKENYLNYKIISGNL